MERNLRRFQRQELVQEPLITQRNGRLVLMIKADMRSRVPGIVHDVSDTGATVFIRAHDRHRAGEQMARIPQGPKNGRRSAFSAICPSLVGQAGDDLLLMLDQVARLDLNMAKGRYSWSLSATEPRVARPPRRRCAKSG